MVLTLAAFRQSPHSAALNFSPMVGMYWELWKSSQIFLQWPVGREAIRESIQHFGRDPRRPQIRVTGRLGFSGRRLSGSARRLLVRRGNWLVAEP